MSDSSFPQFHMCVDGEWKFMTLEEAGRAHANNWADVNIGRTVLLEGGSTRSITPEDEQAIVSLISVVAFLIPLKLAIKRRFGLCQ